MELPESNGKIELLDLPSELIPQYALSLNLGEINHLCRVSKKFNQAICANEHFWKMKFVHDYKFTPEYNGSWLKLYQNYNSVWSFGANYGNREDRECRLAPTQLSFKAKAISAGGSHTVLIDLDDNVWSFGLNGSGQLGLVDRQSRLTPTLIHQPGNSRLPFKAKAVSAGDHHTIVIDLEDNVWSFGWNYHGQLGLGDETGRSRPEQIPGLKAKAVSAGESYTMLIDLDDNVWSFGRNDRGQLGLGDEIGRSRPEQIPEPKAKVISAGGEHTVLIDLDDNVWSFGWNHSGQLGLGDERKRSTPETILNQLGVSFKAKAVSSGTNHTVVIDLEDNIWSFGCNNYGQHGTGDQDEDENERDDSVPMMIPGLKAKAISAGYQYTVVIDLEDNVWSFGDNMHGQLGLGDTEDRFVPVLVPNLKAKAISAGRTHTVLIATLITS